MLLFVYGTLKHGYQRHELLDGATYKGVHITDPIHGFYNLGLFPGMTVAGDTAVQGEVYDVEDHHLSMLDQVEGHPHFYKRNMIPTRYGPAWTYMLPQQYISGKSKKIISGTWTGVDSI